LSHGGTYAIEIFLDAPPDFSGSVSAADPSCTTTCAFNREIKPKQSSSRIVIGERILGDERRLGVVMARAGWWAVRSWDDWSDVERLVKKVGWEWNEDGVCDQIRSDQIRGRQIGKGGTRGQRDGK
jgi:hypothetical protein